MINQNRRLLNTLNHIILKGFFVFCLVAAAGIFGCSDSGGKSKTAYHLSGYDGGGDGIPSGEQGITSALGNTGLDFYSQFPWFVNLTFQVFDEDMWGLPDLVVENFSVMEDGVEVSQINSEMNIRKRDFLPSAYSYTIKTVLLLDNTPSTSLNLEKMIEAAQVIVDNMDEKQQQEIAIVAYDEAGDFTVIQDFTNNISVLNEELINLQPSYGTTNFYGAVIDSLALFDDNQSPANTEFVQGFVVAITDGLDTSNLNDVGDAMAARGDQQVITVAVGDLPEQALSDLDRLGNSGYYPVPVPDQDPDEKAGKKPEDENLCEWMLVIQNQMVAYADGFYWIQYKSASTSADQNLSHNVTLSIIDNGNEDIDSKISGRFSSKDFFSGATSIYFNASAADPDGITDEVIVIERGQGAGEVSSEVSALTYSFGSTDPSQYTWSSGNEGVVTVEVDPKDSSKAIITVIAPGETQIVVSDTTNGVQQTLAVTVKRQAPDYEFIQHVIDSASPWFADATFQVRETESENNQWVWITDLIREDFTVMENSEKIDFEKSEVNIRKRDDIPSNYSYAFKTVLLIDNSPSVGSDNLALIKDAAKAFVNRALENDLQDDTDGPLLDDEFDELATMFDGHRQQEIAIVTYAESGDSVALYQDFTSDVDVLEEAIDGIERGYGPTDFYGGMIDALNLWENDQSPYDPDNNDFVQGAVIAMTDGNHSITGFHNADSVLVEIEDRQVFTVGVGDDLISEVNDDLVAFGNAGFYSVSDPGALIEMRTVGDKKEPVPSYPKSYNVEYTSLEKTLMDIQDQVVNYANSFYWLDYKSYVTPASDCMDRESLEITINNNQNTGAGDSVAGQFESCDFFEGIEGSIYINYTASNPWGEDGPLLLEFYEFDAFNTGINSVQLEAVTYQQSNQADYEWIIDDESIAVIEVDETNSSRATLSLPDNPQAGSTVLRVIDHGNGGTFRNLTVNVEKLPLGSPIAFYPFNGNADDESGNNHDGEAIGALLTDNRFGAQESAYEFNGFSDYIELDMAYGGGPGSVSDKVDEVSVCAWVKFTSSTSQAIISFGFDYWVLFADVTYNHKVNPFAWHTVDIDTGGEGLNSSKFYNDDQWHFVCATYNSDVGGINKKLYVDGALVSQAKANDGNSLGDGEPSPGYIGASFDTNTPGWYYYFEGVMDDVLIFEESLTDEEVQDLYTIFNETDL